MVAQRFLAPFVGVRVPTGQPKRSPAGSGAFFLVATSRRREPLGSTTKVAKQAFVGSFAERQRAERSESRDAADFYEVKTKARVQSLLVNQKKPRRKRGFFVVFYKFERGAIGFANALCLSVKVARGENVKGTSATPIAARARHIKESKRILRSNPRPCPSYKRENVKGTSATPIAARARHVKYLKRAYKIF